MKHAQFDVMLLLQVFVLAFLDLCSSYYTPRECYGGYFTFTHPQSTTSIFYKPKRTDDRILVVNNGKSLSPRFEVSYGSTIKMKDLTDEDDGAIIFFDRHKTAQLTIRDCAEPEIRNYGGVFSSRIPSSTEYLEFTQVMDADFALETKVIWNRTVSSPTKGKINQNYFEIYSLKQQDSGYYKFRGSGNQLVKWKRLKVEAYHEYFARMEGAHFDMQFPVDFSFSHILFTSQSVSEQVIEKKYLSPRMEVTRSYFIITDVKRHDAGTYKFIDTEGYNVVNVQLDVIEVEVPTWAYIVIVAVIVLVILICCCCIKKCCCKKSKRNSAGSTEAAAPTVRYLDSNQPAPPGVPFLTTEPRRFVADTTIYNTADNNINPPPSTQTTVPRDTGSLFTTSIDYEPKFELKGSVFPSAAPLSSDMCIQDVYTSDKLNF